MQTAHLWCSSTAYSSVPAQSDSLLTHLLRRARPLRAWKPWGRQAQLRHGLAIHAHAHALHTRAGVRCRRLRSNKLELEMPEIDGDLRTVQADSNAAFEVSLAMHGVLRAVL